MAMNGLMLAAGDEITFFQNEGLFIPSMIATSIVVVICVRTIGSVLRSNSRERTRREIAAYIAEGTMTPEQGERMMTVGRKDD